jgi:RNA polymerase sigma factor (sigma-70 family)
MARRRTLEIAEIERVYRQSRGVFVRTAAAIAGDWWSGEDAVHDAFVSAVRRRRDFRGEGSVEAWLWRIVVNAARARARQIQPSPGDALAGAAGERDDERRALIREVVQELPERQRLVLFLRYYADLDYDAIAAALAIRPGTVAATLHAAHAALRRALLEVD